jgi:ABC-2 type transport system permease protein
MTSSAWVARAVARRTIRNTFRSPGGIIPSVVPPLFFLTAFAGGLSRLAEVPHFDYAPGYTSFVYAFAFLQSATLAGVFTGFGIAKDFDSGMARRLLASAPARGGIILGYLIAALARWGVAAVVVTIAGLCAGADLGGPAELAGLAGIGVLLCLVASLWACGAAMFLRSEQAGALIQLPVFLLLFLAPVYVPVNLIGGWVHTLASVNPITVVLEAARGLLADSPTKLVLTLALLAAGILVMGAWARRGLASAEKAEA